MGEKIGMSEFILRWRWPAIALIVLAALAGIQLLRVNQPQTNAPREVATYSTPGALVPAELVIPAKDFYSTRININRRAKLSGSFKTGDVESRVSILVLKEQEFERWKLDADYSAIVKTGYVPVGRISPVLEPGAYFLVIDNRVNDSIRSLRADFTLE